MSAPGEPGPKPASVLIIGSAVAHAALDICNPISRAPRATIS